MHWFFNPYQPKSVVEVIDEIKRKSAGGSYIFRGEPECHEEAPHFGRVSSNLWRVYRIDEEYFDIELVQKEMLVSAKRHTRDLPPDFRVDVIAERDREDELKEKPIHELSDTERQALNEINEKKQEEKAADFEILAEIQHYGGKTNLIDFTTDYLIALFFACEKSYSGKDGEVGRVIIQNIADIKDMIEYPKNPQHRAVVQKSVFIRPPKGYIKVDYNKLVRIPSALKQPILKYLQDHHGIDREYIYNDLHGFIRCQDNQGDTYTNFYKGLSCGNRAKKEKDKGKKKELYTEAVRHYDRAIEYRPDDPSIHSNRGNAYLNIGMIYEAFNDYNKAIGLRPDSSFFYYCRAEAYVKQGEFDKAMDDYAKAMELQPDSCYLYCRTGIAYAKQGNPDKAFDVLDKAMERYPNLAEPLFSRVTVYYELGIYYLKDGEWGKAKDIFEEGRNYTPSLNVSASFYEDYESVEDFEVEHGIELRDDDLRKLLTSTQ